MTDKTHTIDAEGKSLGRVASEAAVVLRGKNEASYQPNKLSGNKVSVVNAAKLNMSDKKKVEKKYTHYTGYPGGLRETRLEELIDKRGVSEAVRRAVEGMIPRNKLRNEMMKNLTISE